MSRYHKRRVDPPPAAAAKKAVVKQWLEDRNVDFDPKATKVELQAAARAYADTHAKFKVTEIAAKYGHDVIFTPPYVSASPTSRC